jgi:bacterioferritin (cytochrome b1)
MPPSTNHRSYALGLALAFGALLLPLGARAQNASPFNAGGNSGNNSLGSSTTSIGTPDFSRGPVSQSQDVTVQADRSLTTSPEKLAELREAIRSTLSQSQAELLTQTTNLANQLVDSGVEPLKANQLVSLLVDLEGQPNLNQLSDAINLFNQVIRESSPEILNSLSTNSAFVAISTTLRSARSVFGS